MKKLIAIIFITISGCFGFHAQQFHAEVSDTTLYGYASQNTFYGDIDLINDAGSSVAMTWKNIEVSVPNGWTVSNCDPVICHPVGVLTANFNLAANGGYLNTHFYPNGVTGSGYMRVKVYPQSDSASAVILTYYGVAGTVGIEELSAADIMMYPNPASEVLTIMFPNDQGSAIQVRIIDLLGKEVMNTYVTGSTNTLNVAALTKGIYLLEIGGVTKRFQKL